MGQLEVVHLAGITGIACDRCGEAIAVPSLPYRPGTLVVVYERDPVASWRTLRRPTCEPFRRRAA